MNCCSRLLRVLYAATSALLAGIAGLELRYGPLWTACVFAAAALVPVIAVVRETMICDERRHVTEATSKRARCGGEAVEPILQAALEAACCERWWTSLGRNHDAGCQKTRSGAA